MPFDKFFMTLIYNFQKKKKVTFESKYLITVHMTFFVCFCYMITKILLQKCIGNFNRTTKAKLQIAWTPKVIFFNS